MQIRSTILILIVALSAIHSQQLAAQPPERPGPPARPARPGAPPEDGRRRGRPDGFRPPPNPLLEALDTDGDRELSEDEIANATKALRSLDRDEDGTLSRAELRPRLERGDEGFGPRPGGPPEGGAEFRRRGPPGGPEGPERGERRPAGEGFDAEAYVKRIMRFDENDDGEISSDELPERMRNIITKGDSDENGALSAEELQAVASARPGRRGRANRERAGERPARPDVE